jgi:hypothetical protein
MDKTSVEVPGFIDDLGMIEKKEISSALVPQRSVVAPSGVGQYSSLLSALTAPSNIPLGFDPALWCCLATPTVSFPLSSALPGESISMSASFPQDVVDIGLFKEQTIFETKLLKRGA